jgi:hypothetical protein
MSRILKEDIQKIWYRLNRVFGAGGNAASPGSTAVPGHFIISTIFVRPAPGSGQPDAAPGRERGGVKDEQRYQ